MFAVVFENSFDTIDYFYTFIIFVYFCISVDFAVTIKPGNYIYLSCSIGKKDISVLSHINETIQLQLCCGIIKS